MLEDLNFRIYMMLFQWFVEQEYYWWLCGTMLDSGTKGVEQLTAA